MWNRLKKLLGIDSDIQYFDEILCSLHSEVINRNLYFHLFIIVFEVFMAVSISLREGGPFAKPRRTAYFTLYLIMVLATFCVILAEHHSNKDQEDGVRRYFRAENAYMVFFSLWGVAVTLTDQLGGNGLTVFNYVILIMAILALMKPWKTALLFFGNFILLNVLLPYFPDPAGLDNSFNNFMNSLFLTLAATAITTTLYNSKIRAKQDEIIISRQFLQIEAANKMLSKEALFDALTGLRNRNSFKKAVQTLSGSELTAFACIYIDINGLHEINNYLGHQAGDAMLKTAADILLENFSSEDIFRIGGDEFIILCSDVRQETMLERAELIRRQIESAGYSFSLGLEWRDSDIHIRDIIQTAEAAMRRQKKEYYQAHGGERQKQTLTEQMERMISEKKDAERFLSVLAPVFKGVYFVNPETDTLRQIFIPDYFQEMLHETGGQFSRALLLYAHRMVEPDYLPQFEQFCDYSRLENLLDGDEVPGFVYQKKDGGRMNLRVLKFNHYPGCYKELLWIFSDVEAGE